MTHRVWKGKMLNPLQPRRRTISESKMVLQQQGATSKLCREKMKMHPRRDLSKVSSLAECSSISTNIQHIEWQLHRLHLYTLMVLKIKVSTNRQELQASLRLINEEFWLASHPDNGAEPVHTVGGDIGVVHTADSSSTTSLSGGLAHTQL